MSVKKVLVKYLWFSLQLYYPEAYKKLTEINGILFINFTEFLIVF